ncbi:MAG: sugar phosphate isomerase/epimerase [Acidobacteriaceae bacterium]|nr:sugar phosphate isomerase/epimerase [Acidobacteriaceae bacterium]MBV9034603.1 sugar phosphate isomerase/epimerase [Acidobacteriaceae bacterium]
MSDNKMSRRYLLYIAPALGASALLPKTLSAQEYRIAGADIKLGVASYSFRKFGRTQAIQMTKELGTPYLNVKDFHLKLDSSPEEIDAAKKEFADAGIILVGCGNVSFQKNDEADIRNKFEYAKRAGFPLIVCAPTAETLPKLEKYVKEYNIKIAVHNHGPEDKHFPTPQSVLQAVKNLDPRCGLCMDVGHTSRTGVDIVESMAEAGPRLLDMHIKDLADPKGKNSQVPVGDGKLPIARIFIQLIKMKYNGSVNLEYEIQETAPLPGMQKSFSYMRGVLAGIEAAKYNV